MKTDKALSSDYSAA